MTHPHHGRQRENDDESDGEEETAGRSADVSIRTGRVMGRFAASAISYDYGEGARRLINERLMRIVTGNTRDPSPGATVESGLLYTSERRPAPQLHSLQLPSRQPNGHYDNRELFRNRNDPDHHLKELRRLVEKQYHDPSGTGHSIPVIEEEINTLAATIRRQQAHVTTMKTSMEQQGKSGYHDDQTPSQQLSHAERQLRDLVTRLRAWQSEIGKLEAHIAKMKEHWPQGEPLGRWALVLNYDRINVSPALQRLKAVRLR